MEATQIIYSGWREEGEGRVRTILFILQCCNYDVWFDSNAIIYLTIGAWRYKQSSCLGQHLEKEKEEKEKSAFFSSSFAEDRNGAALDDPELVPQSEMWTGQHNNQPVGALRYTYTIYTLGR